MRRKQRGSEEPARVVQVGSKREPPVLTVWWNGQGDSKRYAGSGGGAGGVVAIGL